VTATTAVNPTNRRARTAPRRRASPRSCSAASRWLAMALSTPRERFVALRNLLPSASSSKQRWDEIEQTKLDLVEEIAAECDLYWGPGSAPKMCQCIPPGPKLST